VAVANSGDQGWRQQGNVACGGSGLQEDAAWWPLTGWAGESVADADGLGVEVDVLPGEAEQFGEAHAGVERGSEYRTVARQAVLE
jgi:hypothetical protein